MQLLFIILLVFVLLGAVGVATSKEYKDTPEGRKKRRNILGRVAVFAIILLILIDATGGKNSTAKTTTAAATPTPSVAIQVDTKSADTDYITSQVKKYFKDLNFDPPKNLEIVDYEGGGYGVYTDYTYDATNKSVTQSIMADYYLMLHKTGKNIRAASIYQHMSYKASDLGGDGYYKTIINDADWSKINWNQADTIVTEQAIPGAWKVTLDFSAQIH